MSQVNDDIFANTGEVQINDGMLTTFGSPPDQLNDAKLDFTGESGAMQDAWYTYLTGLGYSGALSDMWAEWWAAGGAVSVEEGYSATLSDLTKGTISGTDNEIFLFDQKDGAGMAVSTSPLSGKIYLEVYNHYRTLTADNSVGIALNGGTWLKTAYPYQSQDIICYGGNTNTYVEGVNTSNLSMAYPNQGIVGVAIDTTAGKVWFSVGGVWDASHNPNTPVGGETMPGLQGGKVHIVGSTPFHQSGGSNYRHELRLASGDLTYAIPTGFSAAL